MSDILMQKYALAIIAFNTGFFLHKAFTTGWSDKVNIFSLICMALALGGLLVR